jgi:dihydrofolate synthase/folylpolyglutamate synthase
MLPADLAGWLAFVERQHPAAIALGLERVGAVLERLALPKFCPIFTVGGTNGKGSTCAMLEACLLAAGYRVGLYTSPHLVRYNERVRIAGREADDAVLVAAFAAVERARLDTPLTYFEFGTLAAWVAFAHANLDVLVLEVGLGGRLDAVNAFEPDCAILTSVDLDHMDYLGETRERIGWEKAHIFRAGRPAVIADPLPPVTVLEHAAAIGARTLVLGRDFGYDGDVRQWRYRGPGGTRAGLAYPALRGANQLLNASACITALDALRDRLPVSTQAIREGLALVQLPGRFQVLPGRPTVILDVAHNPHASAVLAANLAAMDGVGDTLAVFAVLRDKDVGGIVAKVAPHIDRWFVASLDTPRGASAEAVAGTIERVRPDQPVARFPNPREAFAAARESAGPDDRIVVFGSFFTVADVMTARAAPLSALDGR